MAIAARGSRPRVCTSRSTSRSTSDPGPSSPLATEPKTLTFEAPWPLAMVWINQAMLRGRGRAWALAAVDRVTSDRADVPVIAR